MALCETFAAIALVSGSAIRRQKQMFFGTIQSFSRVQSLESRPLHSERQQVSFLIWTLPTACIMRRLSLLNSVDWCGKRIAFERNRPCTV